MNHTLASLEEVFGDIEGGVKAALDAAGIRPLEYDPFDLGKSIYPLRAAEHLADLRAKQVELAREEAHQDAIFHFNDAVYRAKLVPPTGHRFHG